MAAFRQKSEGGGGTMSAFQTHCALASHFTEFTTLLNLQVRASKWQARLSISQSSELHNISTIFIVYRSWKYHVRGSCVEKMPE